MIRDLPPSPPLLSPSRGAGSALTGLLRRLGLGERAVDAVLVTVAGSVALLAMMVMGLYLARTLGPTTYGRVTTFLNEYLLFSLVAGFGLTVGATSVAAQANRVLRHDQWSALCALRLVTLALPLLLGAGWATLTGEPLHFLAALGAGAAMLQDFSIGALQGLGQFRAAARWIAGQPLLLLLGIVLLVHEGDRAVTTVLLVFLGASLLASAGAAYDLAHHGLPWHLRWDLAYAEWGALVAAHGQLQVVTFLTFAFGAVPLVVLGNAGLYTEAGLLSVVRTLVFLVPSFAGPTLGGFYFATACRLLARGAPQDLDTLLRAFARAIAVVGGAVCCWLIAFPALTLQMLYSDQYLAAAPLLMVMAGMSPLLALDYLATWTLLAHQCTRRVIVALAVRLALILTAVGVFVTAAPGPVALWSLGAMYLLASLVGLSIEFAGLPRTTRPAAEPLRLAAVLGGLAVYGLAVHALDARAAGLSWVPAVGLVAPAGMAAAAALGAGSLLVEPVRRGTRLRLGNDR